jgi:hypothetical protein
MASNRQGAGKADLLMSLAFADCQSKPCHRRKCERDGAPLEGAPCERGQRRCVRRQRFALPMRELASVNCPRTVAERTQILHAPAQRLVWLIAAFRSWPPSVAEALVAEPSVRLILGEKSLDAAPPCKGLQALRSWCHRPCSALSKLDVTKGRTGGWVPREAVALPATEMVRRGWRHGLCTPAGRAAKWACCRRLRHCRASNVGAGRVAGRVTNAGGARSSPTSWVSWRSGTKGSRSM